MKTINYDRSQVRPGILHIGVGNFHRAHMAYYINHLLALDPTQRNWGIVGAMLLPEDEPLYNALSQQDGKYTLSICGRDGTEECEEIGSIVELLYAGKDAKAIIDRIADPDIRIISLTITEGGYNIDNESGRFDLSARDVAHDIKYPGKPKTVFGYVAEGLRRRHDNGAGAITILSCDNLQHNGDTAHKAFTSFIRTQDPKLARWVEKNVTFPNSMVDRITPATLPYDVGRLNRMNGTNDAAPVYCEDFTQWAIEDNFANGRPEWGAVGVQMVNDVTDYENLKINLINASHTLMSYPAYLAGYRKVDEAINDPRIAQYVYSFTDLDVSPYLSVPKEIDLDDYKHTMIDRLRNRQVSDQVARLCADGLSKFAVYITPTLTRMVTDRKDITRMAFLLAAYRHYLKYGRDDNGETFDIIEPRMTPADRKLIDSDEPREFLNLSPFSRADLNKSDDLVDIYLDMVADIDKDGTIATLEKII